MIDLKIKKARLKGVPASVQQQALRAAVTAGGNFYRSRFLMLRFTRAGIRRYGLKPRRGEAGSGRAFAGSYAQGKVKRRENGQGVRAIGENKPFVWSGESRASAKSGSKVKGVANSSRQGRFEITSPTPNFNRQGAAARINLNDEFSRVAPIEVEACERVEAAAYDKHIQRYLARN